MSKLDEYFANNKKTDEDLEQAGVKGMKWGVRKTRTGFIAPRATLGKKERDSEDWANMAASRPSNQSEVYHKVYKKAAGSIRGGTRTLNRDPKFKGQDFRKDSDLRREYYDAYSKMVEQQLNAAATIRGRSPNGKLQLRFEFDVNRNLSPTAHIARVDTSSGRRDNRQTAKTALKEAKADVKERKAELAHADGEDEVPITLIFDEQGYIVDMTDEVQHASDEDGLHANAIVEGEEALEQYGVPGMKWGKRKASSAARAGRKPSEDFLESRNLKKKKVYELSNEELQRLNKRLELEAKWKKANPSKIERGQKIVKNILSVGETVNSVIKFANSDLGRKTIARGQKALQQAQAAAK